MTNKMAAVWARVSTEPQQSLDSQVARAKAELEKQGYIIPEERILKVDWTSLDLFSCPEFKQLMSWIQRREIGALGILDRDRLNAIGLQRLTFLSECRENDVNLVICQGPPLLAEPEGQLVELALAIGKERQVLRAQQGARDALRERATVRGLPVTCQSPYGYIWDKSRTRLIATDKWSIREKIIRLFLQGATLKGIVKELQRAAIPSPKGRDYWPEPTISLILKDTINYGEYRALRREAVQPKTRRGNTYGKSSSTTSEGILLSNITVEKNIISKVEHDFILQRLERNRINAKRNSKRHYLLSGMIHFEGDNLRYHARDIRHKSWAYRYSARGQRRDNPRTYLPGQKTERVVEEKARALLTSPEVLEVELGLRDSAIKESIARLENEQKRLEQELAQGINAESELADLRIHGKISDAAYNQLRNRQITRQQWATEETERVKAKLEKLHQRAVSLVGLEQLKEQLQERLNSDKFEDRRFILEALQTRIVITVDGAMEVEFTLPGEGQGDTTELNIPLNACPQYSIVPIVTPLAIR